MSSKPAVAFGEEAAEPRPVQSRAVNDSVDVCAGADSPRASPGRRIDRRHSAVFTALKRYEKYWVLSPLLAGVLLGVVLPLPETGTGSTFAARISAILGWSYFCAWTVSFYPQLLLNYHSKSVRGLSLDFQMLNLVGFSFYSVYNILLFYSTQLQQEYEKAYGGSSGVRVNDIFFSVHAALVTAAGCVQICVYWDYPPLARSQRLIRYIVVLFLIVVILIAAVLAVVIFSSNESVLDWLAYISMLAEVKVIISTAKYCPQVWLNICRQSTKGWSIENIILDFSGGTLSVAQLLWDAWSQKSWSKVYGDPAKLLLGNISMFFDVIFMVQHYCLYGDKPRIQDSPIQGRHLLEGVTDSHCQGLRDEAQSRVSSS